MLSARLSVGAVTALRTAPLRRGVALLYHAVSEEPGDPAVHVVPPVSVRTFRQHLLHLKRVYRIVSASQLTAAVRSRRPGQRFPVAITFDDDARSHVDLALPVLEALGVPATFFLTGASLEGPEAFWWQRLQAAQDAGMPIADLVGADAGISLADAAQRVMRLPPSGRRELESRLREATSELDVEAGLRREDVRALIAAGCQIGFHTRGHDALTTLSDDELDAALTLGRTALEDAAGHALQSIAYPHGLADAGVAARARAADLRFGFTGRAAAVTPTAEPLLLPRWEPGEIGSDVFARRLLKVLLTEPASVPPPGGSTA